ncbi:hypothetical protein ACRALDRAFT_1062338 [Sodiomyces alcalophilus JCM 7366]|uniref:uncharacterized protein n=1 Tax=Sodiomyces alcalophilus JCM 7366 TaxID=591952 RepID=UPI0039B3F810
MSLAPVLASRGIAAFPGTCKIDISAKMQDCADGVEIIIGHNGYQVEEQTEYISIVPTHPDHSDVEDQDVKDQDVKDQDVKGNKGLELDICAQPTVTFDLLSLLVDDRLRKLSRITLALAEHRDVGIEPIRRRLVHAMRYNFREQKGDAGRDELNTKHKFNVNCGAVLDDDRATKTTVAHVDDCLALCEVAAVHLPSRSGRMDECLVVSFMSLEDADEAENCHYIANLADGEDELQFRASPKGVTLKAIF